MVQSYIINIIISILVVLIFHNVYHYIKETCTTKKTKDIYGYQQQKYSEILNQIETLAKTNTSNADEDYKYAANDLLQYISGVK
jgi:hypothetical protein